MGSTKYVAAVFSMRPRWLKLHPDAARLRIRVLAKKTFDRIANGERADDVLRKRYRSWGQVRATKPKCWADRNMGR
ncbi:hypothetical protein N9X53_06460 [Mariniblastus sp.]|nr:hypothetical protein [Mariniblastus sp.]